MLLDCKRKVRRLSKSTHFLLSISLKQLTTAPVRSAKFHHQLQISKQSSLSVATPRLTYSSLVRIWAAAQSVHLLLQHRRGHLKVSVTPHQQSSPTRSLQQNETSYSVLMNQTNSPQTFTGTLPFLRQE